MNRFQKLMRAAATTVIVLTVGSVLGNDVDSQKFNVKHPTKSFYTCCLMELSEGLAAFRNPLERPSKWGYVDSSGEVVIKPQFDTAGIFSEGLAAVEINGEYGFIDKSGKLVIYPQYTTVSGFTEGVAVVSKSNLYKSLKNVKNFRVGAIDKQGKLVIDYLYEDIHPFSEVLAAAKKIGSNKYGYIDKNGIEIIKASFDSAYGFREGKAAVSIVDKKSKIKKIGFVNRYGEYVIKPQFNHEVSSFSEGLAAVLMKIDGKFKVGFIDEKGNFVINPQYDSAENFSEGLAAVRIGDADNGRVGFIDKSGNMVINPQFKHILFQRFHEGFSRVSIGNKNEKSKWGFIDKKGKFFVNPEFEYATDFVGDFALVGFDENKVGFLKKIPLESALRKLNVVTTLPDQNGLTVMQIEASADTASLKINGEEQGGRADGKYSIKKIARAGGDTQFTIVATDTNGNIDTKTITVSRPLADSKPLIAALNPAQVKRQPERDAVAIIIGIADYKNLPRADYANDDARVFYDYAIRALGVKPENIKLLVDADADEVGIYCAFKTWLPSRVRASTDVYVYYSGHGLPTADGQGIYLLPQRAHRDFIDKTAITQAEINAAIQVAKPKSVTIFLDACYSGQARTGETLLASARPVALKVERQLFPDSFTVISASQADQISSSSPDLKHGIFSYYLMRGMEGDADANRDGKITAGEMHQYLTEQVARQAGMMSRKQEPQLIGDTNRVLVGR